MRLKRVVLFACLFGLQAVSETVPESPREVRCQFSSGKTITITYSPERDGAARMATDEDVITVKGVMIAAGDYEVLPLRAPHNSWALAIKKRTPNGEASESVSMPMSVKPSAARVRGLSISFDHTGGSCMMHWLPEDSNVLLSLEFTEENADMPVE